MTSKIFCIFYTCKIKVPAHNNNTTEQRQQNKKKKKANERWEKIASSIFEREYDNVCYVNGWHFLSKKKKRNSQKKAYKCKQAAMHTICKVAHTAHKWFMPTPKKTTSQSVSAVFVCARSSCDETKRSSWFVSFLFCIFYLSRSHLSFFFSPAQFFFFFTFVP